MFSIDKCSVINALWVTGGQEVAGSSPVAPTIAEIAINPAKSGIYAGFAGFFLVRRKAAISLE
jgi:hypothetical protein